MRVDDLVRTCEWRIDCQEAVMSQVRVHNFSISLDGFGTGAGIRFEAPFGYAGDRLHEWMFATRF